jgi:transposase
MPMSSDDHISRGGVVSARRIEVFTGAGRRREWSPDQKATIIAESYRGEISVCDVARRYGLTPSQLFAWRRAARQQIASPAGPKESVFVPALVDAAEGAAAGDAAEELPLVGFDLEGASVWVCRGADIEMVRAIIRALKASS